MRCPACDHPHSSVVNTYPVTVEGEDPHVKRRRECCKFHHRFPTYESYDLPDTESDVKLEATQQAMLEALKIIS